MTDKEKLDAIRAEIHRLVDVRGYDKEMANDLFAFMDSLPNEPVSEDLEEASKEWLRPQLDKSYVNYGEEKMMELTHFDGYAMLDAVEFGAKWQKEQMELTWEDIKTIVNAFLNFKIRIVKSRETKKYTDEEYCVEILKRFKDLKK